MPDYGWLLIKLLTKNILFLFLLWLGSAAITHTLGGGSAVYMFGILIYLLFGTGSLISDLKEAIKAWQANKTPSGFEVIRKITPTPVVLLRAFFTDGNPVDPARKILRSGAIRNSPFEEAIHFSCSRRAGLVALGMPGEKIPSGSGRIYVKDEVWRKTLDVLLNNAQAVVLTYAPTENVKYELEQLVNKNIPAIIIYPTSSAVESYWWKWNKNFHQEISAFLKEHIGSELPSPRSAIGIARLKSGEPFRWTYIRQIRPLTPCLSIAILFYILLFRSFPSDNFINFSHSIGFQFLMATLSIGIGTVVGITWVNIISTARVSKVLRRMIARERARVVTNAYPEWFWELEPEHESIRSTSYWRL